MSKITGEDLKQIIYQALTPEPLIAEPVLNEDPPQIMNESIEEKLFPVLKKMSPSSRAILFARFGFVLKTELSKDLTQNILNNISNLTLASKGKYTSPND